MMKSEMFSFENTCNDVELEPGAGSGFPGMRVLCVLIIMRSQSLIAQP